MIKSYNNPRNLQNMTPIKSITLNVHYCALDFQLDLLLIPFNQKREIFLWKKCIQYFDSLYVKLEVHRAFLCYNKGTISDQKHCFFIACLWRLLGHNYHNVNISNTYLKILEKVFIGILSTPNSRFRPVFVEMNVEIFYIKRLNMTIIKSDTLEERKILTRFHFKGL